jgi:hypothetical protein
VSLIPNDPRAQFVIAQYLIDEGRIEEALPLLYALVERFPLLDSWIAALEHGETVDTASLRWEPNMVRPMPVRPARPPIRWKPGRLLVALLMVLLLFAPFLQMVTVRQQPAPDEQALVRSMARERAQRLCERLVVSAIADGRLVEPVGSCMEWSFRLTSGHLQQVVRCHRRSGPDELAFMACVLNQEIVPPGVTLPGTRPG